MKGAKNLAILRYFSQHFFRFWVLPPKEYLQINQAKKLFVFGNLPFLLLQSRPSLLSNLAPTNLPNSNWPIATEEMATIDDSLKICKQFAKKTSFALVKELSGIND